MSLKESFIGGLDLCFFPSADFESIEHIPANQESPIIARNILRLLMMGWKNNWPELFSKSAAKAFFIERNPELLKEVRLAFQQGFVHLFSQLEGKQFNAQQQEQVQLYLSNCLCVLPLADINPYESIKIPHCIEGQWQLVEYHVVPIELTPQSGIEKCIIQDHDRVFAYGLEPLANAKAKSRLIFMGTTYPAGQGFNPQVSTDLKGFETVGEALYTTGRERISEWLLKQPQKPEVCGVSLGGSLSLLLAIDQGDLVSRIDSLNPAGLHDPWCNANELDNWDTLHCKPQVTVQQQYRDPLQHFGVLKTDWDIINAIPPKDKQGPNPIFDHILNYAGFPETQFNYVDAKKINKKNKYINAGLYSFARGVLYYAAVVPFNYLLRPFAYAMWQNKLISLLFILAFAALTALPLVGLLSGVTAGVCAATIVTALVLLKIGAFCINKIFNTNKSTGDYADLHSPSLPRNPSMDLYSASNEVEIELTHQQINTYYKMMRCLVKQKEFVPTENKVNNGISKRDLLIASEDPVNASITVSIKVSKAKAIHIKHTLAFVNQLGTENQQQLKSALEASYSQYSLGKRAI